MTKVIASNPVRHTAKNEYFDGSTSIETDIPSTYLLVIWYNNVLKITIIYQSFVALFYACHLDLVVHSSSPPHPLTPSPFVNLLIMAPIHKKFFWCDYRSTDVAHKNTIFKYTTQKHYFLNIRHLIHFYTFQHVLNTGNPTDFSDGIRIFSIRKTEYMTCW